MVYRNPVIHVMGPYVQRKRSAITASTAEIANPTTTAMSVSRRCSNVAFWI